MSNENLQGYVQHLAPGKVQDRQKFIIEVFCDNPRLAALINRRLKNFLNNDNMFATAVKDIEGGQTLDGVSLVHFLISEGMALTEPKARMLISNGNVKRKDTAGVWKIVSNVETGLRPGWWKITRKGMVKVGDDMVVEKRLAHGGVFSKPTTQT